MATLTVVWRPLGGRRMKLILDTLLPSNKHNNTIVHGRLRPQCANGRCVLADLCIVVEQNLVGIDAVVSAVIHSRRLGIQATRHRAHCVKTWRHPQNRKYITYRNAIRGGPIRGHGQHAQKIWWGSAERFPRYAREDSQTDTDRHTRTYHNTSHPSWGRSNKEPPRAKHCGQRVRMSIPVSVCFTDRISQKPVAQYTHALKYVLVRVRKHIR